MTTLIKGGTVVSATGADPAEVLIDGEQIAAVLRPGSDIAVSAEQGAEVVDATGRLVVPGGVDVHTHMELPFGPTFASDTFETGTRAAAWGGTTTILDFAVQRYGENVRESLDAWMAKAEGNCAVDYGFHMIIGGVDNDSLKEMDVLVDEGITSFKLFMAYPGVLLADDGQILRAMQQAAGNGGLIMMHAENGLAIDVLAAQAFERGETSPVNHGYVRRKELESEATHRAIQLARVGAAPLYIVHLSASEALEQVALARDAGMNVFAETCPQYLHFSLEEHLGRPGFEGAAYVCSTPLRSRAEGHQDDLWKGLRTNDLAVVSTDHCPFCMKEQKELGLNDFRAIPNGIGGVEHRMDMIYQGVVTGEISLARWVELCATTPARMMGLYPRKGVIAAGSDADVVIYDPAERWTISVDNHHMNMDHSAYEGVEVTGHVDTVFSRGRKLIDDGQYLGRKGDGQYLRRSLSQYLI
ncbi:MAG: dihydropyrimidinase [Acidimicrobiaceae bacterium]|nr:dihydropyrimidinase [Acidimicrobiaceae bacterium]MCY4279381.1 dihydropyrimidinase [Acidimicrobiaceae bacterium]MCY4294899.1 dihydropyrimidinase [Acidimicrobiaceae bacterium]